jgi:hypothetical protein
MANYAQLQQAAIYQGQVQAMAQMGVDPNAQYAAAMAQQQQLYGAQVQQTAQSQFFMGQDPAMAHMMAQPCQAMPFMDQMAYQQAVPGSQPEQTFMQPIQLPGVQIPGLPPVQNAPGAQPVPATSQPEQTFMQPIQLPGVQIPGLPPVQAMPVMGALPDMSSMAGTIGTELQQSGQQAHVGQQQPAPVPVAHVAVATVPTAEAAPLDAVQAHMKAIQDRIERMGRTVTFSNVPSSMPATNLAMILTGMFGSVNCHSEVTDPATGKPCLTVEFTDTACASKALAAASVQFGAETLGISPSSSMVSADSARAADSAGPARCSRSRSRKR